jgi:hypothetical protein
MTPTGLARKILKFAAHPSVTSSLERALRAGATWDSKEEVWYESQKEHWLGWLNEYSGPGYYGRKNSKRSAEFVYNHINCSPMVLWLGEASGVPSKIVMQAKRAALSSRPSLPSQCAAIRKVIPWSLIESRLLAGGEK